MSYRPHLESGVLRQLHGLPDHAFEMLVTLLARVCDDPYDPVLSAPTATHLAQRMANIRFCR